MKEMKADIIIVGCGVAGLYCALNLPEDKDIIVVTKNQASKSDSYLAQGGICVLRDKKDYDAFFEDTMKAGHYENNPESVKIMIQSSQDVIEDLLSFGVEFEKNGDEFLYTREGAHSNYRILFHEDETGKEITSCLLKTAKKRRNIRLIENFTMVDLICENNRCYGIIGHDEQGKYSALYSKYIVLATGGIGGLFDHSTNYEHLTGDGIAVALKHDIKLKNIDYIQIHPTTLYTEDEGREFLISESVRGEGAVLLNAKGERFVNELLPRDVVTNAIYEEMKKEGSRHVWLSLHPIPSDEIQAHFPNIYQHCLEAGYDLTKEAIPVVPSQHYFMGGIDVDTNSRTSMNCLYAVGETACNGVHGRNRLASNSLLESLVFAKRAAQHMMRQGFDVKTDEEKIPVRESVNEAIYKNYKQEYKEAVLSAIEKEKNSHE